MERNYYTINEETARQAHNMMSFSDYKTGSKTAEYKSMVDKAYNLAAETAKARPDAADRVYALADRYAKKLADNFNRDSEIGTRCPSVLISGAGNFPTRKKEKQVAAWETCHKEFQEIQGIIEKIKNIRYGKEVIKSGDADALEKLEAKLESLKKSQENMKAANRAIRMKDTEKGDAKLTEMGYTAEQIKQLREPDFCGRVGYAGYMLTNNNANIHRIEGRIKSLKAAKEKGTQEKENDFFKVVENTELMRLQLFFDGKPDADVRSILKSNGFKWAPSQAAWQRQLTENARYALKRVVNGLNAMQEGKA